MSVQRPELARRRARRLGIVATLLAFLCLALPLPASSAGCTLAKLAELPVTMLDLRPVVSVKINGADARLIADSGAFYSFLTPGSAAEFKLRLELPPYNLRVSGVGGEVATNVTTIKEFMLASIPLRNLQFVVTGNELGNGIAGTLGQNVLGYADVEYDLAYGAIRIMRPKDCRKETLAYWATSGPVSELDIDPLGTSHFHTIGTAYLNGIRIRVMFDTGASYSLLTLHAAERAGVRTDATGVVPAGFSVGIGRQAVRTWIAPFASFKLGTEEILHTHLRIGDTRDMADADMLVGADFFLSHRVYVSNEQHKLYFTYNGGAVFNLTTLPTKPASNSPSVPAPSAAEPSAAEPSAAEPPANAEPTDAAGFSRRGNAFAARRDYEHALADLTRACELAPEDPGYYYQRGLVHWKNVQPKLALTDFDQALTLKPDDLETLMARAQLQLGAGDTVAAQRDLDAAAELSTDAADRRFSIGEEYMLAGQMSPAIAQFDLWIHAHPQDLKLATAFNYRCRARALSGQDLGKALDDCNAALRILPKAAPFLDSRALVHLRRSDYRKSIADYDAALSLRPKFAWSLYCRGVAHIRLGHSSEGQADIAAATALRPQIAVETGKYGIAP
jgi:tetratricopeptide (TPR) repeat protein/predicted aspartyl protease